MAHPPDGCLAAWRWKWRNVAIGATLMLFFTATAAAALIMGLDDLPLGILVACFEVGITATLVILVCITDEEAQARRVRMAEAREPRVL